MVVVHAVLVGVERPAPIRWGESEAAFVRAEPPFQPGDLHFEPLDGALHDIDVYTEILRAGSPGVVITELTSADDSTYAAVTSTIAEHAISCDCTTFVVVLIGHGFQWRTADVRETDGFD